MREIAGHDSETMGDLYAEFARPRVAKLLKLLKLDLVYVRAQGDQMEYVVGEKTVPVIDLLGGYGSTLLGHNHPEIANALQQMLVDHPPVHAQASIRYGAARVGQKLNELMAKYGEDSRHFMVTLCNSGAEAVEAGLKHALMQWNHRREALLLALEAKRAELGEEPLGIRQIDGLIDLISRVGPVIVAIEGSFHGKTAGSVSVTTNLDFKSMYSSSPIRTIFLERTDSWEKARPKLENFQIGLPYPIAGISSFSLVAGIIFEAIQGEGGIQCLTRDFAHILRRLSEAHCAPLIADEIQCGLFRTGSFLASHALGLKPDYVLLGKSLGGGLAKVSAFMVATDLYQEKFGLVHTSTFSEDELSSLVALKALEIMDRDSATIREASERFEQSMREGVTKIQALYPGVINAVRGRGFLLGIEFNFTEKATIPIVLDTIYQSGFATYVYTSYLLHHHGVRVGVTLSRPDTLRVEPSAFIRPESLEHFLTGLDDLCRQIHERKLVKLTRHFWSRDFTERELETVSPLRHPPLPRSEDVRRIGFLCHVINDTHLRLMDPYFRAIGEAGRKRFEKKFATATGPVVFHHQELAGENGRKVHLYCYGVFLPSSFFERSLRAADGEALQAVIEMAEKAVRDGMDYVGLGQYTSIVTNNGLMLRRLGIPVTTGNGLTAAFGYQGVVQALQETGRTLKNVRVGVVGAAGNIGHVVTQLLADEAAALTLVFRAGTTGSDKVKHAVSSILANSRIAKERVHFTDQLSALLECDVVVLGTNSAESVLFPEHLKPDAIVMDVSVPSNIDARVFSERPDVRCYQGGRAKLPLGQILRSDWLPVPKGETYACMGETICAGLTGYPEPVSFGRLSRETVRVALELAKKAGMEMGSLKRVTRA